MGKTIIVGGVAAGPKAGARIMRCDPTQEVVLFEKNKIVSYSGCGLPYRVSGVIHSDDELIATPTGTLRNPEFFENVKGFKMHVETEITKIDRDNKKVLAKAKDGAEEWHSYDNLVLTTGARAVMPPFQGINLDGVFKIKMVEDVQKLRAFINGREGLRAVVVGGGLINIEMIEALHEIKCDVTCVELLPQTMSFLDGEMAMLAQNYMKSKGVKLHLDTKVEAILGETVATAVKTNKGEIPADIVIVNLGVRPNVELAKEAGLDIGVTGAIKVDKQQRTSDANIYAAGDCCETTHLVTGKPCFIPLGSTANKQGRVIGSTICGKEDAFPGVVGATACKIFDYSVACAGLNERNAKKEGYDAISVLAAAPDRPHFMPPPRPLMLKLVVDKATHKVLGGQAVGPAVADKRMDVVAMALHMGMTIEQLANVDLTYAPPFSPPIDNVSQTANVLRNKLDGSYSGLNPTEVQDMVDAGIEFVRVDVRGPGELVKPPWCIEGAINVPLGGLRKCSDDIPKDKLVILHCKSSLRAYEAEQILRNQGFTAVKVMEGGMLCYPYAKKITPQ